MPVQTVTHATSPKCTGSTPIETVAHCRERLEYWHGIERGRELTAEQRSCCEGLVIAYLDLRAEKLLAESDADAEGYKA